MAVVGLLMPFLEAETLLQLGRGRMRSFFQLYFAKQVLPFWPCTQTFHAGAQKKPFSTQVLSMAMS